MSGIDKQHFIFSLANSKAFLWPLFVAMLVCLTLTLLINPGAINPLRFKAIVDAKVVSVETVGGDVLNPSRKIVFKLDSGEVQWGVARGYSMGDTARVLIYQRLFSRGVEYRLLQPVATKHQ